MMGCAVFFVAQRPATSIVPKREYRNWRNIWLSTQAIAFLSPGIWYFYAALFVMCVVFLSKKTENRVIYYCLLLSSLPTLSVEIPGFGIINYFFTISFPKALVLFLLLPAVRLTRLNCPKNFRLFSQPADKVVFSFIVLMILLDFRDNTFTNVLRSTVLKSIDYIIPYYVVSRSTTSLAQVNKILVALLISFSISALIGIFETVKFWHIYNPLAQHLLGLKRMHGFDVRAGQLRAAASFMGPIVFGYASVIALGLSFYLRPFVKSKTLKEVIFGGLLLGLLATVSRGPWVGFAFLCLVYIWTGKEMAKRLTLLTLGFISSLPVLATSSYGQKFIDVLPFIGTTRADTVEYRGQLLEQSLIVIKRNLLLGSTDYLDTPEMISMTQGQGIIDLVNSFIQVALQYGVIGVVLFVSIFAVLLFNLYKTFKRLPKHEEDLIRLGRCLFSILCAIILMIYTVSSIDYIPDYYWLFFAISTAYIYIAQRARLASKL